ncbi:Nucleoporin p58/p45 [Castilleja foliolosa]|uniref:Nucleoporin p58/p45 n=1 Tax=Castilleja foliolosa TaxID=1961234 RepID=A0ABD3E4H3_9LAMI
MAFSFTPQQQQPQQSLFQSPLQPQQQQSSPFQPQQQQQQFSPFQPQQQSSPFQLQQQSPFQLQPPQQQQQQAQPQQQLYLFTNDKVPATYSTKWADLHPDSQKVLLQIEERILEYRDESQRLDQCSRLYDASVSNNGFELDSSYIVKELGGVSLAMERQKSTLHELMTVVKEMLRNTEVAVRSFMMLRPRFLHQTIAVSSAGSTAPSQPPGATGTQTSSSQAAAVYDFYSGLPTKPSPFLQQTVARFEKYLSECRQWIEELEQLLLLDSENNSSNRRSSLLQSLPKVLGNVHGFFVHVAAKVESIHQYIESMKTAYLADQRRRGEENNPFLEADRRETAKQEAADRRVHPTLHLPSVSQPTNQNTEQLAISVPPGPLTVTNTPAAAVPSGSLFSTPAPSASLFSTPAPSASLFSNPAAAPFASTGSGPSLFSTPVAPSATSSLFSTPTASTSFSSLLNTAATPQSSPFSSTPLFGSTPASGVSSFSTPFATGAATGSGASFGTLSKARAKSRTGRR